MQKLGFCLQTFENLLLQNHSTEFFDIAQKWSLSMCNCSNGGATYITGKVIAKQNLNMANLMYTFENLLLQNYSTEFLDNAHKYPRGMCN